MSELSKKVAIVGIGETEVGKVPGKTSFGFLAEASKLAIEDAGLTKDDIDGVITTYSAQEPYPMHSVIFSEYIGIQPTYTETIPLGGASPAIGVKHALAAISTGVCNNMLIACGDSRLSGLGREKAVARHAAIGHPQFEYPYGTPLPGLYALVAQRHMYEYGTTSEQLAAIAVTCRKHASMNPNAHMRQPITIKDVLDSRIIASPLHLLDCCLISDGGGAIVLTSAERAKDLPRRPVYIHGVGEHHLQEYITWSHTFTTSGAKVSGQRAFAMAGIEPKDIDVAELYDCFTITVLIELEDLGFCKKGEGGPFAAETDLSYKGKLPLNTHGGMLSHCHAGSVGGLFQIIEGVRQLRGEAGERQVKDAELACVHNQGGIISAHCTLILGGE